METKELDFVTIGEIFNQIRRRKWTLIVCAVSSLLAAFLYNRMATPIYRASAIVSFERFSKDSMLEFDFAGAGYKDNFIANRITELRTWTFAQEVCRALPDSFRQLFRLPEANSPGFDPERYIITTIQDNLSVVQTDNTTNLLTVYFDSENAELAKEVTNTAIDVLGKRNLTHRREEFASLKKFIDGQITVVEERLQSAEDTLSNFKSSHNIASLEDESREILSRITQAEVLYNQIQTNKKASERKLSVVKQKIDEQKKNISGSIPETSNPMIAKLKERLIELEVQAASLQVQGYSEDHPQRQELSTEIEQVKQNLIKLTMGVIQDQNLKGMIDPLLSLKTYLEESVVLEIEIQGLLAQQGHLQETLQSYNQRLKSLSAKDATIFDLLRDREINNKLYVTLLEEGEKARLREAAEIGAMGVIEHAKTPLIPHTPRKKLNMIIALFAGSMIGLLLIFLKDSLNDVPRTQEAIEAVLNLPVLASIPKIKPKWTVPLNGGLAPDGNMVPHYRDAYSYLWQALSREKINSVMITSATPGEGKSTVAINLAITSAKHGQETLLIEGDLRRPSLAKKLNVTDSVGLSNFVSVGTESQDMPVEGLKNSGRRSSPNDLGTPWVSPQLREAMSCDLPVKGLKFLSAGSLPSEPGPLWASPQLRESLNALMKDFDFVVIDSPPVLGIPDALSMASYVDAIIFCVEAEQVNGTLLLRARKILTQTKSNLVGVVWNKVDLRNIYGNYKYEKYYQASVK